MSHHTNSFNNINSFNNVWNNCTIVDDRSQLLAWLSPLEPKLRHGDIQERRVDNVGEWLMETEEFRNWHGRDGEGEGDKAVLFCYGDPGVGKTFISSLVVDTLCDQAREGGAAVTCFYFDFAARKEHSATSMLGSLLKQVVSGVERIPEEISRAFREEKNAIGGRALRLPDIVKMLQAITSSRPTFICIDALDECAAVHRGKILDSLKQILGKSPGTRVFVTGRPHIRAEIEKRLAGRVIGVPLGPRKHDIIRYLRFRLSEDEAPDAMDEGLEADILEKIPENISEMFLLVSLNIEAILQESTIHRRRERLRKMTDGLGLGDAYGATIERIKAQSGDKSALGMAVLMWVSHAERPLQAGELCHALAVELGSTDFNVGDVPSISTLVNCCQGLIAVDKEASTVRLVHFTLQEYLSAHPDIFNRPHSAIAEVCLTYLNSQQVKALSADPFPNIHDTPFLEYCSVYWGVHAKRELSDCARSLALDLFRGYDGHISTKLLFGQVKCQSLGGIDACSPFSGLHCASFFGIAEIVAALAEKGCYDIDEGDFGGHTPFAWAARNGHEEAMEILLGREEVNPDKPDNFGRTPLSHAAGHGYEEVVKILLGQAEVSPDKPDNEGQTPLSHAARGGHEKVVKILLVREGVNPDKPDNYGRTPLSFAALSGDEGVVKTLLEREEVSPDKPDKRDRTPLSFAAAYGCEGVVKILLEREDINPDKPDNDGITPLSHAASCGHGEVVKALLRREEVSPDEPDSDGQTPLSHAACGGHEEVVKILLMRGEVNPDKPDDFGQTPLSHAAGDGHEEVVKILLMRGEVSPDKQDNDGRTPLSHAATLGYEGTAGILLGREEVNPDKPDGRGRTPLSFAARYGHEGVMEMLLRREEVNPDRLDNDGQTPLSGAAAYGREGAVKILLGQEGVNPNKPDNDGRTPLSHAAGNGRKGVVKILLGREEVHPDKPDNGGQTPLSLAAWYGQEEVVKLLLMREEVSPDRPDSYGRTPLSFAATRGHNKVVALLRSRKAGTPSAV